MERFFKVCGQLLAGAVLAIAFSQSAWALEMGARVSYWFPNFKSDIRVDGSSLRGTEFNVRDALGLGNQGYPSLEVFGGLGKHHLRLMYTQANYSDNDVLASQIVFNGTTFPAGTPVSSNFKIRMLDLTYQYDLINMENILAGFSIGAIGKIKYLDIDGKIDSPTAGTEENIRVPVPMVGAAAHVGILANILEARAELTGIGYSSNYLYEATADLSFTPFPLMDIHGGYKVISVHVDHSDVFFTSDIAGPYVALTVGF